MDEKKIIQLITSEYSWEQIIYKVIAWEGLDPWDLDLKVLSDAFLQYLVKLEELDFKIPAKYIIIAAVLLRMKSDHLKFLEILEGEQPEYEPFEDEDFESIELTKPPEITPINAPPKRFAKRKVMVDELVLALRRALKTKEKKRIKRVKLQKRIVISQEDVTERINSLYDRINNILEKMKKGEVKFSQLVKKWERDEIVDTFMPLLHLEQEKKVQCSQENMFDEITIRRRDKA